MSPTSYRTAPPRDANDYTTTAGVAPLPSVVPAARCRRAGAESEFVATGSLAERIPKVHLHCHLEGSLRAATFVELAAKHGVPLRYRPSTTARSTRFAAEGRRSMTERNDPYRFEDFREFSIIFAAVSRSLPSPTTTRGWRASSSRMRWRKNVIYGELFVSPSVWTFFHPELDVRATIRGDRRGIARGPPARDVRADRGSHAQLRRGTRMQTARLAASMTDFDVIGVGLGGDEARFPAGALRRGLRLRSRAGLHCVAHAGEAAGPESVHAAVEVLRAERIGHGIRALRDRGLRVELLAERGIPLEICPTSNELTGIAAPGIPHPFLELRPGRMHRHHRRRRPDHVPHVDRGRVRDGRAASPAPTHSRGTCATRSMRVSPSRDASGRCTCVWRAELEALREVEACMPSMSGHSHFAESIEEYLEGRLSPRARRTGRHDVGASFELGRRAGVRLRHAQETRQGRATSNTWRAAKSSSRARVSRSRSACCGATVWPSACSPTCSACRGTRSTPKRACSNTRSRSASRSGSSTLLGDPQTCPHGHPIPPPI